MTKEKDCAIIKIPQGEIVPRGTPIKIGGDTMSNDQGKAGDAQKHVKVRVSGELHKKFMIRVFEEDTNAQTVLQNFITEYVAKRQ